MWSLRLASAGGVRADATSKGERLRGYFFGGNFSPPNYEIQLEFFSLNRSYKKGGKAFSKDNLVSRYNYKHPLY